MSKLGILLCLLIATLISIKYFNVFDKGHPKWETCKESLIRQIIQNTCTN